MDHLNPEELQRYLAGESNLADSALVEEHLTRCHHCESLLAAIAADDAALTEALRLSEEEAAWVAAQDLRPAITERIIPWVLQPQGRVLLLIMLIAAGWMLDQTVWLLSRAVDNTGPVAMTLTLVEWVGPLIWRFLQYAGTGGPLAILWPIFLLIVPTVWIRRRKGSYA